MIKTLALMTKANAEATYDWEAEQWTIPVYAGISKVLKINSQLISIAAGVRYWAATTDSSPEGIALRISLTFMFPK